MIRLASIPLIVLLGIGVPVFWAYPGDLPWFRAAGIMVGWVGCGLLLVCLFLMLREPRLASALGGLERMYRWHHRVGMAAYVFLLLHPLLLAANPLPDWLLAWRTLTPFGQGLPVWLGWASLLLLMLGLGFTFARQIPYGRWRGLHISLGLAVILGLLHLIWLGIEEPVFPLLGLAAVFLAWRLLREDRGWSARPYTVRAAAPLAEGMVEVTLSPLAEALPTRPGQFVLAAFYDGPVFRGCGEFHPFTIAGQTPDGDIRLGIKALGDCTRHLQTVDVGTQVRIDGAFGDFLDGRRERPQFWLAGGIGITPFVALLRAGKLAQTTTLLYLYRKESDAAFLAELEQLAQADPRLVLRAFVTGDALPDLAQLLPDRDTLAACDCYLCGPPGLIATARNLLRQRGVRARAIHFENFEFR